MRIVSVIGAILIGCSVAAPVGSEGGTSEGSGAVLTSTTGTPTTSGTSSGATSGDATSSSEETSAGEGLSGTFIARPDAPQDLPCDVWAQDCPPGQKCAPYYGESSSKWDRLECVPVVDEPAQPGEPCTLLAGPYSGKDDCALGSYCWDTNAENQGICQPLCTGSAEMPECLSAHTCAIVTDVLAMCFPWCDPVENDCPNGDLCIVHEEGFLCVLQGVQSESLHAPCEYANACASRLTCVPPDAAVECDPGWNGCCEAFCDVYAENTCTGMGQTCQPWFAPGEAPPGWEYVGLCRV